MNKEMMELLNYKIDIGSVYKIDKLLINYYKSIHKRKMRGIFRLIRRNKSFKKSNNQQNKLIKSKLKSKLKSINFIKIDFSEETYEDFNHIPFSKYITEETYEDFNHLPAFKCITKDELCANIERLPKSIEFVMDNILFTIKFTD
jgi:hypothetical protein